MVAVIIKRHYKYAFNFAKHFDHCKTHNFIDLPDVIICFKAHKQVECDKTHVTAL